MGRLIALTLSDSERSALEKGYRSGKTHGFRLRCQMILLKAQQKPSRDIAQQLGCCMVVVNHWVRRYKAEGIDGLSIRQGRGRKTILSHTQDLPAVRRAVQENRQRLSLAQESLQVELGKEFSTSTLKRFLKSIVADTNGFVGE
jgi:transposase